ncbi:MAG: E3 binding domain-containing protein [Cypionkella sp.]
MFASPLARRIAAEKGLDLSKVQGSGPHGRIVRADVEDAKPVRQPLLATVPEAAVAKPGGCGDGKRAFDAIWC